MFTNFVHKCGYNHGSQAIYTIVIVTIFREFTFDFEINSDAVFVTNRFYLSVFNSGQGVSYYG